MEVSMDRNKALRIERFRHESARARFLMGIQATSPEALAHVMDVAAMLEPEAWDEVGQYEAWLDCVRFMGRSMNAPNPDGTRWRVEYVPGVVGYELTAVVEEEQGDGVMRFEEEEEDGGDVASLLNELLHEVRELREAVAEWREERKPRTVVISRGTEISPEVAAKLWEMMGWG